MLATIMRSVELCGCCEKPKQMAGGSHGRQHDDGARWQPTRDGVLGNALGTEGMDTEGNTILLCCSLQGGARMGHPCRSIVAFSIACNRRAFNSGVSCRNCLTEVPQPTRLHLPRSTLTLLTWSTMAWTFQAWSWPPSDGLARPLPRRRRRRLPSFCTGTDPS